MTHDDERSSIEYLSSGSGYLKVSDVICIFQHTINSNNDFKIIIKENKNKELVLNDIN